MITFNYTMPSQKIRIFQVKKKKVKKGDKSFQKSILNNRFLPDGNEDEYQQDDVQNWAARNIGFLNNSPEWGNDFAENDWVQNQKNVHQSVLLDTSKLTKNLQKDSKIVQLQSSQHSPLLKQNQPADSIFTDNQFPPNMQSLTGQWGKMEKYKDVQWKRAAQELKDYVIFGKKIYPKDPIQGKLGNCYFLAGLAALAERPDRIFSLFLVKQVNSRGYLSVKMLVKGRWRVIDLDQHFPFENHLPVFSHVARNQLWVMILQKAWAKIYSCYMGISSGHVQQSLHDLTGAPIKFFKLKSEDLDKDRLWKYLMKASKKEYAMCASSNKGSDEKMSETGIVLGHAYTILNATILEFQGNKIKLLQLRNPWARKENLGLWGDKDPNWKKVSAQQKERLHYEKTLKDGIFYIQFEDFLRQYRAVTIAQINDNASYVYQTVKDPNISGVYFKVQIKQNGHYSFQVDKTSKRFFTSKKQIGYKYPSATVKIYSQSEHYKEIHHFEDKERLTSRRYSLFKGLYIVFVQIQFNKNYETDYDVTLAIYSEGPATIQIASKKDIRHLPNLTRQSKSNNKPQKSRDKSKSRPKDKGQETKVSTIKFHYSNSLNYIVDQGFNQQQKKVISQDLKIQIKKNKAKKIPIIHIGGKKPIHHQQPKNHQGNHFEGQEWINQQAKNHNSSIINGIGKSIVDIVEHQVTFIEPCPQTKKVEQIKLVQKDYFDERFPANLGSLAGQWGNLEQWKNVRWQRISKIMPNAQIFQGKITPQSIKQGFLGDCYFLAGIAALAQRPGRIFNLFLQHQRNALNSYSVKLLYKGKWLTINMDDYIPYMYDLPAFSRANQDELWVMLLQKAWAKIYSSYKRIEAGFPEQTLHDLTGAPIKHIFMQRSSFDINKQWTYLTNASVAEYAMVASSQAGSDSLKSVAGIVQGHAYTLLQVAEVEVNNRVERLVQLRNPWGKGENTGRWADNDPIWNLIDEKTKAKLGYTKVQDGIFYMPYESFCKQFKIITIAQINDNASYVYKSMKDPSKNGCYFKVQIIQKGKYSFQVDSTPQRTFQIKYNTTYRYPNIKFELGMLTQQGYIKRITSMEQNSRTSFYISDFQVGLYICFVRIDFDPNFEKDFDVNLAIYGDYASNIQFATKKQAVLLSNNPNVKWGGQETLIKPEVQWNALRSYRKDRRNR